MWIKIKNNDAIITWLNSNNITKDLSIYYLSLTLMLAYANNILFYCYLSKVYAFNLMKIEPLYRNILYIFCFIFS